MSTDDVAPILAPYRDRSSNYSDVALFDHLPMTVAALMEMGAGRARTAAWAERYAREHGLRPATAAERDGRRRWRARIDALGRAHVIATSGTRLAGGIGAAAFTRRSGPRTRSNAATTTNSPPRSKHGNASTSICRRLPPRAALRRATP